MIKTPAMSVPYSCCFRPNFLVKVKTHFRFNNTALEKCIFLDSEENRRISLLTTRAREREQGCNLVHANKQNQKDWVHFVGVGGCGLSALALLAVKQVSFFRVLVLTEKWYSS